MNVDPKNRQAGKMTGAADVDEKTAKNWLHELECLYSYSQKVYAIGLEVGIPKEIARCAVTVARYSQMRASANLRNWLAFVTLRSDPKAQQEIRAYSDALGTILAAHFPRTWAIFQRGKV